MLYIKNKNELSGLNIIGDVELRFKNLVNSGEYFDSPIYSSIMAKIDSVTDKKDQVIRTKMGLTTIHQLSTGCKSVILALYNLGKDEYVCIDECGENALNVLAKLAKQYDIKVYTNFNLPFNGNDLSINFNKKTFTDGFELYKEMMRVNEHY